MLALDVSNEEKMNQIRDLKLESSVQNMSVIVCFGVRSSRM